MNLYFSPLACSLATRIALYEAGADARYTEVDLKAKRLPDGGGFLSVNSMGQVPVLEDGDLLLTENTAVLQHVAESLPEANLVPRDRIERSRMRAWLGFIGTELHKAIFAPLFDRKAPETVQSHAREKIPLRFAVLQSHLSSHDFLVSSFTVADAYLVTVLNWTVATQIDLSPWSAVRSYHTRLLERPSIAKAVREERALYETQQARVANG
jgi:glutathione S-transferase